MTVTHLLVVATGNKGKLEELRALLADLPVELVLPHEATRQKVHVVEDGETFEANAVKKARAVAHATMAMTLADDSGLEVDALDGRPGVRSARFAHDRATDAENNAALLSALEALGDPAAGPVDRFHRARFRCVLALVDPYYRDGEPQLAAGTCEGTITRTPRGSGGFGYDPLFVVDGTDRTMAELSEAEKNQVSHRARAMLAMKATLQKVLAARAEAMERAR